MVTKLTETAVEAGMRVQCFTAVYNNSGGTL